MKNRWLVAGLLMVAAGVSLWDAPAEAAKTASSHPFLLIGMDGGEWKVIEDLWSRGELPALKSVADRGIRGPLGTQYGQSPVIWTTIATGVTPEVHGITGFVVATDDGDVPVSSTMRRVPALWNIASAANLKVNVIGWWGSWPAEQVNGVVLTEKAQYNQPDIIWPAERAAEVKAALPALNAEYADAFPGDANFAPEDRVTAHFAPKLTAEGFDAQFMYLHGSDPNSHRFWRYYRPQDFEEKIPQAQIDRHKDKVPDAYRSIDAVIGRVLAAAPSDVNVMIVSDHGFHPLERVTTKVVMDMDDVLERLGYLKRDASGQVDYAQSRAYTVGTRQTEKDKRIHFNVKGRDPSGVVDAAQVDALRAQLTADLARLTYKRSGTAVFDLRDPDPRDAERGADVTVRVLDDQPSKTLLLDGSTELKGIVQSMVENSGGHSGDPPGIFLAAGPDIDPKGNIQGISVLDIAPTALYAMGLPVADDFVGKPYVELFNDKYRKAHPLQTIPSYGQREFSNTQKAGDNDAMLEQLRELGYID
ncbi:MAG: alkaline phosphatase family protein [Alphaproteobacteria bacterium]|nr:alkaline phosphatase family protein [Alphaproteobacteria bacterium]